MILSTFSARATPSTTPAIVPMMPVNAPHRKKTRRIDPSVRPMVRRMPISRPLFLTSMISPLVMFIDAIRTSTDRMTNITSSSMSRADRNDPELSRQDQVCAPSPAARISASVQSSTRSGSSTKTSISSATPSRLK